MNYSDTLYWVDNDGHAVYADDEGRYIFENESGCFRDLSFGDGKLFFRYDQDAFIYHPETQGVEEIPYLADFYGSMVRLIVTMQYYVVGCENSGGTVTVYLVSRLDGRQDNQAGIFSMRPPEERDRLVLNSYEYATFSNPVVAGDPPEEGALSYHAANLQGLGSRTRQEDSFTVAGAFDTAMVREKGLLFAVCDGMGGMRDGRLAGETAIQSLRQSFVNMDRGCDLAAQLRQSVLQASAQVEARIGGDGGSTVVIGILYQGGLYYASVGDSFLYLLRNGELLRLNAEHNLCRQHCLEAIRDGDMDPLPIRALPDGVVLTEFLGMVGLDEVDCSVSPLPMEDGDVLLACSDGVGGVLSPAEVAEALQKPVPEEMCADLEAKIVAHCRPNQDNYTAIVVKCVL